MAARRWVTIALVLAVAVTAAAAVADPAHGTDTPGRRAPSRRSPAPSPVSTPTLAILSPDDEEEIPFPPPRQPPAAVNVTACLDAYRASGDARAYLCCVDRSMGFCVPRVEYGPDEAVCTVDWKPSTRPGGRQCCFRARAAAGGGDGGGAPTTAADGTYGAGVAPQLDVDCRAYGLCPRGATTRPAPAVEAAAPVWILNEAVTRCGSWAPGVYRRCNVTLCEAQRKGRIVRGRPLLSKKGTSFCGPRTFGNPAKCCLRISRYWQRVACCNKCRPPTGRKTGFGCCWAGPKPRWVK